MEVRIIKCSEEQYWYNDKIAEQFIVEQDPTREDRYMSFGCMVDGGCGYIAKEDCILLSDTEPNVEDPKKLAEDHWDYVESVLVAHGEAAEVIYKCGFHYRTAIEHGFKHGVEAAENKNNKS